MAKVTVASYVPSLIRTFVPVIVGALVAWLGIHGLNVSQDVQAGATAVATAVITILYYAAVRALETKFPMFGVLLGYKVKPLYPKAELVATQPGPPSQLQPPIVLTAERVGEQ